MSYLIDTCVISEYIKAKPDINVSLWFDRQQETQQVARMKQRGMRDNKIPQRNSKTQ